MTTKRAGALPRKDLSALLEAVFTVCLMDKSLNPDSLEKAIAAARRKAAEKVAMMKIDRESNLDYDALGLVIYRWERLPKYLDSEGKPIPLSARGPSMSIEALFKEVKRANYFAEGMKHLQKQQRIRKTRSHRYLPTEETTLFRKLTPEVVKYLTHTINRLVATVMYNTSLSGREPLRLIERLASVSDLPKKQVPAFKKFAHEQGAALIYTLNDWLESRRDGSGARRINSRKHLTAGVHLFGFLDK